MSEQTNGQQGWQQKRKRRGKGPSHTPGTSACCGSWTSVQPLTLFHPQALLGLQLCPLQAPLLAHTNSQVNSSTEDACFLNS